MGQNREGWPFTKITKKGIQLQKSFQNRQLHLVQLLAFSVPVKPSTPCKRGKQVVVAARMTFNLEYKKTLKIFVTEL